MPTNLNGIALESFGSTLNKPGDTENLIRVPLQRLGYTIYHDYNAKKARTLSDYVKGKTIIYSFSHGVTAGAAGGQVFPGSDSKIISGDIAGLGYGDGIITPAEIAASKPDCRLVIIDACIAARTQSTASSDPAENVQDAQNSYTYTVGAEALQAAFGEHAAFVGWCWEESITAVQPVTSEFISFLRTGLSVQKAHDALLLRHSDDFHKQFRVLPNNADAVLVNLK